MSAINGSFWNVWNSQQDFIGIHLMINGDLNNNERVSLLFILMLCLSGERKQSGVGERKKGDLSPFLRRNGYL